MKKNFSKNRLYIAYCDDGRSYFEFYFYSAHRAGSKANADDAREHYASRHGQRNFKILSVSRSDAEGV